MWQLPMPSSKQIAAWLRQYGRGDLGASTAARGIDRTAVEDTFHV